MYITGTQRIRFKVLKNTKVKENGILWVNLIADETYMHYISLSNTGTKVKWSMDRNADDQTGETTEGLNPGKISSEEFKEVLLQKAKKQKEYR